MLDSAPDSFEEFAAAARAAVEQEALDHADDRWWILEPTLLIQTRKGRTEAIELTATDHAGSRTQRLVVRTPLTDLTRALDARRCALALHVDLLQDGEPFAAIVLAVAGALAASYQQARVERTELGTPRLGPWEPAPDLAMEVETAVRRALA